MAEGVPWTAYRDGPIPGMDNNKVTEGPLPETIPVRFAMGSGRMHENAFANLPQSQREAAKSMGMKSDPRYTNDVNDAGDNKDGDEQAQDMMHGMIPDGSEKYEGESRG